MLLNQLPSGNYRLEEILVGAGITPARNFPKSMGLSGGDKLLSYNKFQKPWFPDGHELRIATDEGEDQPRLYGMKQQYKGRVLSPPDFEHSPPSRAAAALQRIGE